MAYERPGGTMEYDYLLKIILIGDMGVGKSSLLLRYIDNTFDDSYVCTIGVDFKIKTIKLGDKIVKLQIWDTAGQERFKPITRCYYSGSHGAIVVFDVTNPTTYQNAKDWVKEYKELNSSDQNLILIGNKVDVEDRKVSMEDGKTLGEQLQCKYVEASAKNNEGVEQIFACVAEDIVAKMKPNATVGREASIFRTRSTVSLPPVVEKSRCC